jgi:hypothetical protein
LFSDKQISFTEENRLAIKYPSNFFKYFAYRLLPNHLSQVEFDKARKEDQGTFNAFIEKSVKSELHFALITRLKQIQNFESKADFEKIINGIFFLAQQEVSSKNWYGNSVGYDAPDLANKLSNSSQRLEKLYGGNKKEVNDFILSKFNEAKSPYVIEAALIKGLSAAMIDDEYIISKAQLTEILLGYLKKYLSSSDSLDLNAWYLFQYCEVKEFVKDASGGYTAQTNIIFGANDAFVSFISEKNLLGFLNRLISPNPYFGQINSTAESFSIWDIVVKIFGSWKEFQNFLSTFESMDLPYVKEFLEFYEKCIETNFTSYTPFEFKHLNKKL